MQNDLYSSPTAHPAPLVISLQIETFLKETIRWGKFLSILGFIFTGLIALAGVIIFTSGPFLSEIPGFPPRGVRGIGIFYVLLSLVYFFPSRFIYKFSNHLKMAFFTNDQQALNLGFENLKSNFKFCGITAIVMIIFYIIVLLGVIASKIF